MVPEIEHLRHAGDTLWFEYHCCESDHSADAQLWYRSHQRVRVVGLAPNDGYYPAGGVVPVASRDERGEGGTPIVYTIAFEDSFQGDAFEDELLDSQGEFYRPDPPKGRV